MAPHFHIKHPVPAGLGPPTSSAPALAENGSASASDAPLPVSFEMPPFQPHRLFPNGHLQTIVPAFLPKPNIAYRAKQHRIALVDGDQLVLHDDTPPQWQPGGPIVILLHGLGGDHRSSYVVRTAYKLNLMGVRTFALDLRGCGAGFHLARQTTHAGRSDDASAALACVRKMCPASPIVVVGYSMSGNLVLKMAAEYGEHLPAALDSIVAISPPVDLEACSQQFREGWNRWYDRYYLKRCMKVLTRKNKEICPYTFRLLGQQPKTLREFDDLYTAPLGGFESASDYYAQSSTVELIPEIAVPSLIITAEDDPIIPVKSFANLQLPEHVLLHITRSGGHLGFYGRSGCDPDRHWLDWRIVQWVTQRLGLKNPS